MQRILTFVTGALALIVVAAATGSAITYVAMNGFQTLSLLGNAALNGIGMAVGGCLGGALVLRFKAARRYVNTLITDIRAKHEEHA